MLFSRLLKENVPGDFIECGVRKNLSRCQNLNLAPIFHGEIKSKGLVAHLHSYTVSIAPEAVTLDASPLLLIHVLHICRLYTRISCNIS